MDIKTVLEAFRDLRISREDLYKTINTVQTNILMIKPVIVSSEHLVILLETYKKELINKDELIEWVNIIWFSDWYEYCEVQCDSIASVMSRLEEMDEKGMELTISKIDLYIDALRNNKEILNY